MVIAHNENLVEIKILGAGGRRGWSRAEKGKKKCHAKVGNGFIM